MKIEVADIARTMFKLTVTCEIATNTRHTAIRLLNTDAIVTPTHALIISATLENYIWCD